MSSRFHAVVMDLDGLLVDTELFHYRAYKAMCAYFGEDFSVTYAQYLHIAGSSSTAIREKFFHDFPYLFDRHTWEEMYTEKQRFLHTYISSEPIPLMPGVEEGFLRLVEKKIPLAVVTHSSNKIVKIIRDSHPIFSPISMWIGREDYQRPKPYPDGYETALSKLHVLGMETIGFEDTYRGILSLKAASIHPVLINDRDPLVQKKCLEHGVACYKTFSSFSFKDLSS